MKKRLAITGIIVLSFFIILHLWNSYKPGFVYENGTWNYVSYDAGVGRRITPINVKKDEFKFLKHHDFARDNTSVYFKSEKIEGSDPDTFQIISDKGRYRLCKR